MAIPIVASVARRRQRLYGVAIGLGCLAALVTAAAAQAQNPTPLVAFTAYNNVYLSDGGTRQAVTTRGSGVTGISYPWYAWSHDGAYLLLVRKTVEATSGAPLVSDLLLLDRHGVVLRTLGHPRIEGDYPPTWASDGDSIAYEVPSSPQSNAPLHTVDVVDLTGKTHILFRYNAFDECGGGTGDPAEATRWTEVGYEGRAPTFTWTLAGHRAIYSATCAGGINTTDTSSGATRRLSGATDEVAVDPSDPTLLADIKTAPGANDPQLLLTRLTTGGDVTLAHLGSGELPRWSPDGRTLYFVRRTLSAVDHVDAPQGHSAVLPHYKSAIWRINVDGRDARQVLQEDAYAFGPLQVSADGGTLFYTRIPNDTVLRAHAPSSGQGATNTLSPYRPPLTIERVAVSSGRVSTFAAAAARPALQP